jgi:ferredoxin
VSELASEPTDTGSWHLEVDGTKCILSGMCVGLAPDHFELGAEHSEPRRADVVPDDVLLDAAATCPVEAITVYEEGRVIAPEY